MKNFSVMHDDIFILVRSMAKIDVYRAAVGPLLQAA